MNMGRIAVQISDIHKQTYDLIRRYAATDDPSARRWLRELLSDLSAKRDELLDQVNR